MNQELIRKDIENLFQDFYFLPNITSQVMVGKLNEFLLKDTLHIIEKCKIIKTSPMSFLKAHINDSDFSYQLSLPHKEFEESYLFPFLNFLGEYYLYKSKNLEYEDVYRQVFIKKYNGHFDGYDIWANFSYKGDKNSWHAHGATLSGIIYIENDIEAATQFEEFELIGKKGDVVIFPSELLHNVEPQEVDYERITISFNLLWTQDEKYTQWKL
jgi:hypothetical protein